MERGVAWFVREFTPDGAICSSIVAEDESAAAKIVASLFAASLPAFAAGYADDREGAPVTLCVRDTQGLVRRFDYGSAHADGSWTPHTPA